MEQDWCDCIQSSKTILCKVKCNLIYLLTFWVWVWMVDLLKYLIQHKLLISSNDQTEKNIQLQCPKCCDKVQPWQQLLHLNILFPKNGKVSYLKYENVLCSLCMRTRITTHNNSDNNVWKILCWEPRQYNVKFMEVSCKQNQYQTCNYWYLNVNII